MNKHMYTKKQKGFTIIELVVVVAVIAILAAIILSNVTQYNIKGKDAAIKGNLSSLVSGSTVYFESNPYGSNNGTYNKFCYYYGFPTGSGTGIKNTAIFDAVTKAGGTNLYCICDSMGVQCNMASKWCACANLNNGSAYCVDSAGTKKETPSATCGATRCSAGSCI